MKNIILVCFGFLSATAAYADGVPSAISCKGLQGNISIENKSSKPGEYSNELADNSAFIILNDVIALDSIKDGIMILAGHNANNSKWIYYNASTNKTIFEVKQTWLSGIFNKFRTSVTYINKDGERSEFTNCHGYWKHPAPDTW